MNVIGIDIGFGFTKAAFGRESMVFKSVIGEATEAMFKDQLGEPSVAEYLHVEVDGNGYYVGALAENQSGMRFATLDQTQLIARFAKVLALTALSRLVDNNALVHLVTGLPVGFFREHKEALEKQLTGRHAFRVVHPNGKREERVVLVSKLRVIPQPFGSMFNLLLNDRGEAADKRFMQQKVGIIDIGFRTADYTIADRGAYLARGSRTTDAGISSAFQLISNRLHQQGGVEVPLYRLHDAVQRGHIRIFGKEFDLKPMVEEVFGMLAQQIAAQVNQLWAEDWDIETVVLSGGGGAVLAPYLKPLLKAEPLTVDPQQDARFNNVRGYLKYGRYLWERSGVARAV